MLLNDVDSLPLGTKDRNTWDNQESFLSFMGEYGTIKKSCELSGVNAESTRRWRNDNVLGFKERFRLAQDAYGDHLEAMVHERLTNPQGNRGSDVLLMGALNANRPDKWRPNVKITHDVDNELIAQLQRLQNLAPAPEPKALPPGQEPEAMPWE